LKLKVVALLLGGLILGMTMGGIILWIAQNPALGSPNGSGLVNNLLSQQSAPSKGQVVADFSLSNLAGDPVKLSQFHGHPMIVNFWATWCGPCKDEMPLLEKTFQNHHGDLVILGVNIEETPAVIKPFLEKYHISFPVVIDSTGEVENRFLIRGYPTSLFVDANGVLQGQHIGVLNEDLLSGYLDLVGVQQ
jgi:thiol-disulfide isomerase/thioredoxin